ncbi:MAG: cardiolipin synthetase [Thermoleophilia bacterium]|nr:cardiolipin synthetase [Thermoleophilia bacterium]
MRPVATTAHGTGPPVAAPPKSAPNTAASPEIQVMGIGGDSLGVVRAVARTASKAAHAQVDDLLRLGDEAGRGLVATTGNKLELIEGTEQFAARVLDDIRGAQHHITISQFAVAPGEPGGVISHAMLEALKERSRAGVEVTMLLDQIGSRLLIPSGGRRAARAMVASLRDAGVDVHIKKFSWGRGPTNDAHFAANHRKIYEIDARVTYQGGMNVVDGWAPWHDLMLRAEGPIAAQAGAVNVAGNRALGGSVSEAHTALLHRGLDTPVSDARSMALMVSNGNRTRREVTELFVDQARTATKRLWIANPYLADPKVMREVVAAAERGVDVRVLVTSRVGSFATQPQDFFTAPLRYAWAQQIQDAGGTIFHTPGFSHAKAWIADDLATVGSFNLDRSSTIRNYENAIVTDDVGIVASLEGVFGRREELARTLAPSQDAQRGWKTLATLQKLFNLQY